MYLRAFAPWREMGFLIQTAFLAKAQRREVVDSTLKGR
jgi:hypothetical protein